MNILMDRENKLGRIILFVLWFVLASNSLVIINVRFFEYFGVIIAFEHEFCKCVLCTHFFPSSQIKLDSLVKLDRGSLHHTSCLCAYICFNQTLHTYSKL